MLNTSYFDGFYNNTVGSDCFSSRVGYGREIQAAHGLDRFSVNSRVTD